MTPVWALAKLSIKEIFRKKDFYVAFVLIAVVLFYAAQLRFYNVQNVVRYLMDIGLMLVFLFSIILTVSLAARQYPSELQNRTSHALLAKPISRAQFVFGKFLGSYLAGAACFVVFYILFVLVASTKGGAHSTTLMFQTAFLFLLGLLVVTAMASGFSYYFTVGANVSVSLVIYLLIDTYGEGLKESSRHLFAFNRFLGEAFYYLMPHFEFFDLRQRFIHEWGPLSAGLMGILAVYALVYAALFLALGWLKLRKAQL